MAEHEITMPIPVVDGESGVVDEYGVASTEQEAIDVANEWFADPVVWAYIAYDVVLRDGRSLPAAWVACTENVFFD